MIEEKDKQNTSTQLETIKTLNRALDNTISKFSSPENLIELVQFGSTEDKKSENTVLWVKCKYHSGNTYLYTRQQFIDGTFKSLYERLGEDEEKVKEQLKKKYFNSKQVDESILTEDEKKDKSARKRSVVLPFFIDTTPPEDEEKMKRDLGKIFSTWYSSQSGSFSGNEVPVEAELNFMFGFTQQYDINLKPVDNDLESDVNDVIQVKSELGPKVLYNTGRISSSNGSQIWKQGISPISWTGKKLTKKASTTEELDSMEFSLDGLENVKISEEVEKEEKTEEKSEG